MSYKLVELAINNVRHLNATQKMVLIVFCHHMNKQSNKAWPSLNRVAEMSGITKRSATAITKQLRKLGYLKVAGKTAAGVIVYSPIVPASMENTSMTSEACSLVKECDSPAVAKHVPSNQEVELEKENQKVNQAWPSATAPLSQGDQEWEEQKSELKIVGKWKFTDVVDAWKSSTSLYEGNDKSTGSGGKVKFETLIVPKDIKILSTICTHVGNDYAYELMSHLVPKWDKFTGKLEATKLTFKSPDVPTLEFLLKFLDQAMKQYIAGNFSPTQKHNGWGKKVL